MGNTRDTGYLQNIVQYDASNNITLPANLTVTGVITGYATTSYVGTQLGGYVPTTRTISINGTSLDLSANRSFTINSMVYPGAGIAVSTGSAWGTSLTDNSSNWNTAYGWGNHAGLYSLLNHTHTFASLTSIPTTLVGYGITDAATSAQGTSADTAYGWGNHAIAGYLTGITSGQVTTALGFTPYNATNPSGYITTAALSTYATESYVGTQIANLVASSPATLDTLNELATALGNDAAFSTTVSTALGNRLRVDTASQGLSATLQGYGRTNLGLGTAATSNTGDFVAYRTFGTAANSAIGDFVAYRTFGTAANNNTGDFAAASHTHSIANVTGLQTALDGKQASGSYAAATHTHIISDVTGLQTALDGKQASLGFTPYNSTNPSGYISSYTETDTLQSVILRNSTTNTGFTIENGNSTYSTPASTNVPLIYIHNTSTNANGHAILALRSMGPSGGNPFLSLDIDGVIGWHVGVDNADSDTFKIGKSWATVGANTYLSITTSGNTLLAGTLTASNFSGSSSGTNTGDQTNISGNAATATNVAWTGVTGRPTALSSFTNDLGNYGGWITSYSETDTLATVVARGNSTSSAIRVKRPTNKIDNNSNPIEFGGRVEYNNNFSSGASAYTIFYYPSDYVFRISADYDGNIGGAQPHFQIGPAYIHVNSRGANIGYVGIGTDNPLYTLDVNGTGRFAGAATFSTTISVTGNASFYHGNTEYTMFRSTNEMNHYDSAGSSAKLYINWPGGDIDIARSSILARSASFATLKYGAQFYADSAGNSPAVYFGAETSLTSAKAIYLETYWMVLQGHYNEGYRFRYVNGAGATTEAMTLKYNNTTINTKITYTDATYMTGSPTYGFRFNSSDDAYNNVIMYNNGNTYFRTSIGVNVSTSGQLGGTIATKIWVHDGVSAFANSSTGDSAISTATSSSLLLGPRGARNGTAGLYLAGISFDHLLSYSGAGTNFYSSVPHAWVGLRMVSYPGWETSAYVIATRNDVAGTAGTTLERMCVMPDGKVGIGIKSPSDTLHVYGTMCVAGSGNYGLIRGYDDPYHGIIIRGFPTTATNITDITATDCISFYEYGGDFRFYQKNATGTLSMQGRLLTGTFTVTGDVVAYGSPSDISLKENIKPIESGLDKLLKLQGVTFNWKEETDANQMTGIKEDIGFIAQQVQEILPELVRKNDNGLLSLRDKGITAILVEAVKEQQTQIESQKSEIDELKDLVKQLINR